MDEFISREATIKRIKEVYCVGCNSYHGVRCRACGTGDAIDMIEDAPPADVAPVVHGRWVDRIVDENEVIKPWMQRYYCSECLEGVSQSWFKFCPNCGAKMDGGGNDEAD